MACGDVMCSIAGTCAEEDPPRHPASTPGEMAYHMTVSILTGGPVLCKSLRNADYYSRQLDF